MPGGCAAQSMSHNSRQNITCLRVQTKGELPNLFRLLTCSRLTHTECAQV